MNSWTAYLLSAAIAYAGIRFVLLYRNENNPKYLAWAGAGLFYFLGSIAPVFDAGLSHLNLGDWFQVTGISLVLVALSIENWQDRPAVARFPFIFTLSPLLLILTFILVFNTLYIKDILIGIYEAGGILVAMLLFGLFTSKYFDFIYALLGIGMMLLAFVVYWFPGQIAADNNWIWHSVLSAGCITFVSGYIYALAEKHRMEEEEMNGVPA